MNAGCRQHHVVVSRNNPHFLLLYMIESGDIQRITQLEDFLFTLLGDVLITYLGELAITQAIPTYCK